MKLIIKQRRIILALLFVGVSVVLSSTLSKVNVYAADARNFNAGRIIDDSVFTNSSSMSVQDIQNFLNSKVTCDPYGQKTSELGGGTRAQWLASHNISTPVTCLPGFYENPTNGQNNFGKSSIPAGAISAAQIIYNYSQQFSINPQVIITTLQKENGLVTDEWPTPKEYTQAMGFACPDNTVPGAPACDPTYGSFSAQVYQAARHFRGFFDNQAGWYIPFTTGNNQIMWNTADTGCGSGNVFIENRATVALYSYTPYQPNQAAENAQYGYGDGCSAYGNRNFYLYFTDWFGSTYGSTNVTSPLTVTSGYSQGLFTNNNVQAQFTIRNTSAQQQDIGTIAIAVRNSTGANYDFGSQHIILSPGQQYTYTATRTFDTEDTYTFSIVDYRDGIGWSSTYPDSTNNYSRTISNAVVQNMPTVVSGPSIDSTSLHSNELSTARFTVQNNSKYPVNLGYMGLAMSGPTGRNADLPFDTVNSLAPGATYNYNKTVNLSDVGTYNLRVSSTGDGGATWSETKYPAPMGNATNRLSFTVKPNPTVTQGLTMSDMSPHASDTVTGTFKVKNFGSTPVVVNKSLCYILRDTQGRNNDLGCLDISTLQPGQELTYTGTRTITLAGQYHAYFSMFDGSWHDNWSFSGETGSEANTLSFTVKSNPTLTQGLTITNPDLHAGDIATGTFEVSNKGTGPVVVNKSLCYILRDTQGRNNDLGCLDIGTLQPGQVLTYTGTHQLAAGQYRAYFSMFDGSWHDNWSFDGETGSEAKTLSFAVKSNPTLTQGLTLSNASPQVGDVVTGTFKIKNFGSIAITVNKSICFIMRDENNANNDLGCLDVTTMQPGQELTYVGTHTVTRAGQYRAYFSMFDGSWHDNWSFDGETGSEAKTLSFAVSS